MERKTIFKRAFSGLDWLEIIKIKIYDKELAENNDIFSYCASRKYYLPELTRDFSMFKKAWINFHLSLEQRDKSNRVFMKCVCALVGTVEGIKTAKETLRKGTNYNNFRLRERDIVSLERVVYSGYKDVKKQIKELKKLKKEMIEQRNNFLKELPIYLNFYERMKKIEEKWIKPR